MSAIAMRIGILFTVLGFGSLILEQFDYEFRLLSWATDLQPTFGIALGVGGLVLIAAGVLTGRAKKAKPQQPPAPGAPQSYPGQAPQQPGRQG